MNETFTIRTAVEADLPHCHELIGELALYEKAAEEFHLSQSQFLDDFRKKKFDLLVAEEAGKVVGMALSYHVYSTWKGSSLYLEDLIVTEKHRGKGIGKALLDATVELAKEKKAGRLRWQVLDWNDSAIEFYKRYPVELDEGWINVDIRKEHLKQAE